LSSPSKAAPGESEIRRDFRLGGNASALEGPDESGSIAPFLDYMFLNFAIVAVSQKQAFRFDSRWFS